MGLMVWADPFDEAVISIKGKAAIGEDAIGCLGDGLRAGFGTLNGKFHKSQYSLTLGQAGVWREFTNLDS